MYFKTLVSPTLCTDCNNETYNCNNTCGEYYDRCGKITSCKCNDTFECINGQCVEIDTLQNEEFIKETIPIPIPNSMYIIGFQHISLSALHLQYGFEIENDNFIVYKNDKIQQFNYKTSISIS